MQREKLAGRYKTKTAMYEALMFLLIWYSVSTTLFQIILSKIFISDCVVFFDTIATFIPVSYTHLDVYKRQAMFFPVSIIHPAMVCIKVAIVSKNTTQSEINIFDRII